MVGQLDGEMGSRLPSRRAEPASPGQLAWYAARRAPWRPLPLVAAMFALPLATCGGLIAGGGFSLRVIGVLVGVWGLQIAATLLFRRRQLQAAYSRSLNRRLRAERRFAQKERQRSFTAGLHDPQLRALGERAAQQVAQAEKLRDSVHEALLARLDARELTFHRYAAALEQAYAALEDNLEAVRLHLRAAAPIDVPASERGARDTQLADRERATYAERLAMVAAAQDKARELLAANEEALTAFSRIATSSGALALRDRGARIALDTALEQLQHLAGRLAHYAPRAAAEESPTPERSL